MTNNMNDAIATINRQLELCYQVITANRNIVKANAFLGTAEAQEAIDEAKASTNRTEGRIAGLIFARDEVIYRLNA